MLQSELLFIFSCDKKITEIAGTCSYGCANVLLLFFFFAPIIKKIITSLLQITESLFDHHVSVGFQHPTLNLLGSLLNSVTAALERAAEEKSQLLNRVKLDCGLVHFFCLHFLCRFVNIRYKQYNVYLWSLNVHRFET